MGLQKVVNFRVTPTIFFVTWLRLTVLWNFFSKWNPKNFFSIFIVPSSHCGIANRSLKSFPSTCIAVPHYIFLLCYCNTTNRTLENECSVYFSFCYCCQITYSKFFNSKAWNYSTSTFSSKFWCLILFFLNRFYFRFRCLVVT